jgi:excisionase family DNA binding protein
VNKTFEGRLALSPAEAAKALGVSHVTIYRLINGGELKSFTIGRRRLIGVDEIKAFIERKQS